MIWVTTSADGADAHAPRVIVEPRSAWASSNNSQVWACFVDAAGFHADTDYIVTFDLLHQGRE